MSELQLRGARLRGPWHSDICYHCKRLGHWKRNCPLRRQLKTEIAEFMKNYKPSPYPIEATTYHSSPILGSYYETINPQYIKSQESLALGNLYPLGTITAPSELSHWVWVEGNTPGNNHYVLCYCGNRNNCMLVSSAWRVL